MTTEEIREKAIADVTLVSGFHLKQVTQDATLERPSGCIGRAVRYAVSQRETVIRQGELLKEAKLHVKGHDMCGNGRELCGWCHRVDEELAK